MNAEVVTMVGVGDFSSAAARVRPSKRAATGTSFFMGSLLEPGSPVRSSKAGLRAKGKCAALGVRCKAGRGC
jgi:hypothetical protein